uniref:Uncharacterized protein n=1 Tax=Anas platyrhynchos TaxID=8839 RepID=A0A8B9TQN6_ANAPL
VCPASASRERVPAAMDSEFVKLLSPALKTERGIEINICIFILLLQISDGASQAKGWPLLCVLLGEVSITHRTQGFQPSPSTTFGPREPRKAPTSIRTAPPTNSHGPKLGGPGGLEGKPEP